MTLDLEAIRAQFPALQKPAIFLDNPGGTQIARPSLERIQAYLVESNANHGGAFSTSVASDAISYEGHAAMADLLNAQRPEEIIYGPNMTSLTFSMSRALGRTLRAGDEIVVTRLDHDANISPWLQVAEDHGCSIRWVDFDVEDCTLDMRDMQAAIAEKPRLVAVGYASNAVGTINPVKEIVEMAHAAGALVYVDAVQYAPHGPIDVQDLGCDFLVCSAYKFFGPHMGILYGRYDLLESLRAYKVRPAPVEPPGKFETGTLSFEGVAGALGAVEYLEWVGKTFGGDHRESYAGRFQGRKLHLKQAMAAIRAYEYELTRALLEEVEKLPGATIHGITDRGHLDKRVPTVSLTLQGWSPRDLASRLGQRGVHTWDGNYYALAVTERLGLEGQGGMLRIGPAHYNTVQEIHKLGEALEKIVAEK